LLEAELRETAAAEIGLYSVIAEHGSSVNKVHTPAQRLSRHFFHALKNCSRVKMGSAARSATSGLVLVAKACGYDIARCMIFPLILLLNRS
jgi:mevalonate pyrophosphate decarboxylase